MLFLLIFVYAKLGGVTNAHLALTNLMNESAIQEQTAKLTANGFAAGPDANVQFALLVGGRHLGRHGVGIGVLPSRSWVALHDCQEQPRTQRAVASGGVFILMMTGVAFVVGALSNVLFFQTDGKRRWPRGECDRQHHSALPEKLFAGWFTPFHADSDVGCHVHSELAVPCGRNLDRPRPV
jgi:SSS family solute:Na+ symporter